MRNGGQVSEARQLSTRPKGEQADVRYQTTHRHHNSDSSYWNNSVLDKSSVLSSELGQDRTGTKIMADVDKQIKK